MAQVAVEALESMDTERFNDMISIQIPNLTIVKICECLALLLDVNLD